MEIEAARIGERPVTPCCAFCRSLSGERPSGRRSYGRATIRGARRTASTPIIVNFAWRNASNTRIAFVNREGWAFAKSYTTQRRISQGRTPHPDPGVWHGATASPRRSGSRKSLIESVAAVSALIGRTFGYHRERSIADREALCRSQLRLIWRRGQLPL